jgi:hypothetical protein
MTDEITALRELADAVEDHTAWQGAKCPEWPALIGCPAPCSNHGLCAALARVREVSRTWEVSHDNGQTWEPVLDEHGNRYRGKRPEYMTGELREVAG